MRRNINMLQAISEAGVQAMERDERVIMFGEGITDHTGVYGSTKGPAQTFPDRVYETPLSEDAMTGICSGLALTGMRPIHVHQRVEFMMLGMNQLVNHISKWRYMFGGQAGHLPLVVRAVIGRGGGQSAQHSQNLQTLVAHIPGLVVVLPSTPYNAKGLFLASIESNDPVIFIDHRSCHMSVEHVPENYYTLPLGKARILQEGSDITVVSCSFMTCETIVAAQVCKEQGISVEHIDLQTANPIDFKTIITSVRKTQRLVVADLSWFNCSVAATIIAYVAEVELATLKAIRSVHLQPTPTPTCAPLENAYYPGAREIVQTITEALEVAPITGVYSDPIQFVGPF